MTVKVHLSKTGYTRRPDRKEVISIHKEITDRAVETDVGKLARETGNNGKAFMPAVFRGGRNGNFLQQQVFALEFDGRTAYGKFMETAQRYNILPAFVYAGYGHTEERPGFSAVFISDIVIEEAEAAAVMAGLLVRLFPGADSRCSDPARLFFGGSGLLYENGQAVISLKEAALSLQMKIMEDDESHYGKRIKRIGKELDIAVENNVLLIFDRDEWCGYGEKIFLTQPCIIKVSKKNSPGPVIVSPRIPAPAKEKLMNRNADEIVAKCFLLQDFYNGDIPHNLKLLLATNLLNIVGSKKIFFLCLKDDKTGWKVSWKYMELSGCPPQHCEDGNCPYCEECQCQSLYDKLRQRISRAGPDEKYVSLQEARGILTDCLKKAVCAGDDGIYLIRAQTAIGKTTAYCGIVAGGILKKPAMIAVPTIKLQEQVCNELERLGVSCYKTVNLQKLLQHLGLYTLADTVSSYYDRGLSYRVRRELIKYIRDNKDNLSPYAIQRLEDYLDRMQNIDGKQHVVTTHKMLLNIPVQTLRRYEVIVDEDILMSVFKDTASITFEELEYILDEGILDSRCAGRITELMGLPDGTVGNTCLRELQEGELDAMEEKDVSVMSSLPDFFASDTFHINGENECIDYFRAHKLPETKMTVVSATVNRQLYADFCKGRRTEYMEVPQARYKGRLKQYTAFSMSRYFIDRTGYEELAGKIMRVVNSPDTEIITFLKYNKCGEIYFGKTEGFNDYKGKDITVIGTPHNVPFVYRLIGEYLGYHSDSCLCRNTVVHNGYSFVIMTYDDEAMRNLQFFFLESELEQAVGRARLLRYDCTVYLFSNFPLRQAEIIQDNYLQGDRRLYGRTDKT